MQSFHVSKLNKGSALLAMMLVLVISASYVLVSKLNESTRQITRRGNSVPVLNQAKAALIGYAISYPENVNPNAGPGYLPCPDLDNDGDAEGSCAMAGPTNFATGGFPFETLNVQDLRDASGERLWYAISDNYRNFAGLTPLNSDTPGQLTVDGIGDVVAVIFAPGYSFETQDRETGTAAVLNPANYLEDENAIINNATYVNRSALDFNDVLVTITRQELMQAVERRVLGDVAQALEQYRGTHSAYPWLSPFANPQASTFHSDNATVRGHLPFHWAADPSVVAGVNPFNTEASWAWNIDTGTAILSINASAIGVDTLTQDCMENVDCVDPVFGTVSSVASDWFGPVTVSCAWTDRNTENCSTVWALRGPINCDLGCGTTTCYRAYYVNYPAFTGTPTITDPGAGTYRTRAVTVSGALPTTTPSWALLIYDYYTGMNPADTCSTNYTGWHHIGRMAFDNATTTGTISTMGIKYDLDVDNNELPTWFVQNGWQDLMYVGYASGEPLPGDTTVGQDCVTLGTNCISVDDGGVDDSLLDGPVITGGVRAVALSAGVDLTPATVRPNGTLGDYFEVDNAVVDDIFMKESTVNNNDQIRVLATAP